MIQNEKDKSLSMDKIKKLTVKNSKEIVNSNAEEEKILKQTKLQFDNEIIKQKLFEAGFRYYGGDFIRVDEKLIAEIVTEGDVNAFIADNILNWGLKITARGQSIVTQKNYKSFLHNLSIPILKDTKDAIYFCFKNCVLSVQSDRLVSIKYGAFASEYIVWRHKIQPYDFDIELLVYYGYGTEFDKEYEGRTGLRSIPVTEQLIEKINKDSHFAKFIHNICTDKDKGFDAKLAKVVKTAIGYLISQYKHSSYTKVPFFTDYNNSDSPSGGTGKSLIFEAISKVRNTIKPDATKRNNSFVFSNYNKSVDLIIFDEVGKYYKIDDDFEMITGKFHVERKNQNPLEIDFEESPKFAYASNYAPFTRATSTVRRLIPIALYTYYNENFTPIDEFKVEFWNEWVNDYENQWMLFYTFLALCCREFLKNNRQIYRYEQEGFNELLIEKNIPIELTGIFDELLDSYEKEIMIINSKLSEKAKEVNYTKPIRTINKHFEEYCKLKHYKIVKFHNGRQRGFTVSKTTPPTATIKTNTDNLLKNNNNFNAEQSGLTDEEKERRMREYRILIDKYDKEIEEEQREKDDDDDDDDKYRF